MANTLSPTPRVLSVQGDAIIVQLEQVAGFPNEVTLHIIRRGKSDNRFSLAELALIQARITELANAIRTQQPSKGAL